MNDIEVDFTFPQENIDVEPITEDDYDFSIFAVKGDKGDTGERGLQGEQGLRGETGETGATGNGITNIEKTSTSGLVDTYTINYTNGNVDTFNVTNGEKGDTGQDGVIQYTAGDNITIEDNVISAIGGASEVFNLGVASQYTVENRLDLNDREKGIYLLNWDGQTSKVYFKATYNGTTKEHSFDRPTRSGAGTIFASTSFIEIKEKVTSETEISVKTPFFTLYSLHYDTSNKQISFVNTFYYLESTFFSSSGSFTDYKIITEDKQQGITSKKIFSVLPECSVVPTTDNQLVNKKYVDDNAGGGGTNISTFDTLSVNLTNDNFEPGIYAPVSSYSKISITGLNGSTSNYDNIIGFVIILKKYVDTQADEVFCYFVRGGTSGNVYLIKKSTNNQGWGDSTNFSGIQNYINNRTLTKNNSTAFTPTSDYHPATKKYVDDAIAQAIANL